MAAERELYRITPQVKPTRTLPRPRELDQMDVVEAAVAVAEFVGAPQEQGAWKIERFTVSEREAVTDFLRSHGDGKGRWVGGYGEFIRLTRTVEGAESVVMSNTAQEIKEHADPLLNAWGYVLVHGLGLGCVVSGLLAKPEVFHIDVVEIEQDVIDLVGPAFEQDDRVTIHHGDCVKMRWPQGKRWNYVWHDIWTEISEKNLSNDREAEHGISYARLHRKFGQRSDRQGSWAFDAAQGQRERRLRAKRNSERFAERWRRSTPEQRIDIIIDYHYSTQYIVPGYIEGQTKEQWRNTFEKLGQMDQFREMAQRDDPPRFYFDW